MGRSIVGIESPVSYKKEDIKLEIETNLLDNGKCIVKDVGNLFNRKKVVVCKEGDKVVIKPIE